MPTVEQAAAATEQAQQNKNDADAEAQALVATVDDLENRLRSGDRTVTVLELGEAQQKARHALLLAEGHEGTVTQAYKVLALAKVHDSAARLAALDKRFQAALDRLVGPIVEQLGELFHELDAAHTEHKACTAQLRSAKTTLPEVPPTLSLNHGLVGYKAAVDLPDADRLFGELLAAVLERTFGPGETAEKACRQFSMSPRISGKTAVVDLARNWIGARSPNTGIGNRPQYVTVERA